MIHNVKQPLRLVDGKFMRGYKEERAEIGNLEQIELLKSIERALDKREDEALNEGIECEFKATHIRYTSNISFECVCGEEVEDYASNCDTDCPEWLEDDLYLYQDWDDYKLICPNCRRKYIINNGYAKLQ